MLERFSYREWFDCNIIILIGGDINIVNNKNGIVVRKFSSPYVNLL